MNFHFLRIVALLTGVTSATVANADYTSFTFGSAASGWATHPAQDVADYKALDACNARTQTQDCKIQLVKAVAVARGKTSMGFAVSEISAEAAVKQALERCGEKTCKIINKITKPGFYVISQGLAKDNTSSAFGYSYAYTNFDDAINAAIADCEHEGGTNCTPKLGGTIRGLIKVAQTLSPVAPGNCRPNTQPIRCTSSCNNGNCIITYENGCKIPVQVQPRLDPFTNQWSYPSPSC